MPGQEQRVDETSGAPNRRFRLPRLFAENPDSTEEDKPAEPARKGLLASAEMLGATINVAHVDDDDDEADVSPPKGVTARPASTEQRRESPPVQHVSARQAKRNAAAANADTGTLAQDISEIRAEVEDMSRTLQELNERGMTQDKVFNTLHGELQDYKNDFIYEHLKPVVRPLLFLFDSIEQFDNELQAFEKDPELERRGGITPTVVRENIVFFREQLVESLRICEVTPMQRPEGPFDPRLQKAVDSVEVQAEEDGTVQKVVRSGWYLNGRVFRPAEVVVGKSREALNTHLWEKGKTA